jgi:hypothetical protein
MIRQDLREEAVKSKADLETLHFRHLHLVHLNAEFDHMFSDYILLTFLWVIAMTCSVIYSLILMDITPAMKPIWIFWVDGWCGSYISHHIYWNCIESNGK